MKIFYFFFILSLFISCQQTGPEQESTDSTTDEQDTLSTRTPSTNELEKVEETSVDQSLLAQNSSLVDIQDLDPSIRINIKYATTDNFVGKVLYHNIHRIYLQEDVAARLAKVNAFLKTLHPDYSLLVYDGVRPVSVQQIMWDALDSIPVSERTKFVSNPKNGSIHNYGAAVDLTICDKQGVPLDMGADYDDIRQIAYPRLEAHYLSTGELSEQQIANRKLLRQVMASQNFKNIATEWWHFNACSRDEAKRLYQIVP